MSSGPSTTTTVPAQFKEYSGGPINPPKEPNRVITSPNVPAPKTQGGGTPRDFGHPNPDLNGDGYVSKTEVRVYESTLRSQDRRLASESRERVNLFKEYGKNYRAELTAQTEHIKSANNNKAHKIFGKPAHHIPFVNPQKPVGPEIPSY